MTGYLDIATHRAVAVLVGLAIGMERVWSGHASGPEARFAGARTFFLLGLLGGLGPAGVEQLHRGGGSAPGRRRRASPTRTPSFTP